MAKGPRLFDLTRFLSRAGGALTGVDRVDRAYIDYFLAGATPILGLIRTGQGYLLLDRGGIVTLMDRMDRGDWGRARGLSRFSRRLSPVRRAALSRARELAISRAIPRRLSRLLAGLGPDFDYINTGHAHLSPSSFAGIRSAGGQSTVLIHDTIPLDHPDLSRPETVALFRAKLAATLAHADRIIANSEATGEDIRRHSGSVPCPPITVAPLGLALPEAIGAPGLSDGRPYFVALGTIEPRKNHALLLDLWENLGPSAPPLFLVGARGWRNEAVFRRLDGLPPDGPVQELGVLDDQAALGLVKGASALLFPSLAEGYGLPPLEAAALGTPVLASDLPVLRENLGDWAVYLDPRDLYAWQKEVEKLATEAPSRKGPLPDPPTWAAHFDKVFGAAVSGDRA